MINETQKRRLVGLIVLLAIVFILSGLLPHKLPESGEQGVPSTTLPLATNPHDGAASPAVPDDAATAPAAAAPQVLQSGASPQVDASALPLSPGTAPARLANGSGLPAEVSSMPSGAAPVEATAETRPPKPAETKPAKPAAPKPVETKPAEVARAESRPAAPPALKLAQSLPAPSAKVPAAPEPLPKPAKPTPPPVPPMPRLATSVQAPPPPVAAGQGKLWYVQIGSFADQGNAQTTLNLLQNIGFRGESSRINSNGAVLYRVRLGPFPSEAVAQQAYTKVSHQGYPQARVLAEASGKP